MKREDRAQIAELLGILSAKPLEFRVQFLEVAERSETTVLDETSVFAPDAPTAIRMAADALLPVRATGIRVLDHEGRTIFERQNTDCVA